MLLLTPELLFSTPRRIELGLRLRVARLQARHVFSQGAQARSHLFARRAKRAELLVQAITLAAQRAEFSLELRHAPQRRAVLLAGTASLGARKRQGHENA
ncbi:MAG: hypothetical protein U0269_32880 [Polyangiales bacterium]